MLAKAIICTFSRVRFFLFVDVFPLTGCRTGLGLGCILSRTNSVTDSMVEAASLGLADSLTPEERDCGLLYPRIERSTQPFLIEINFTLTRG